MLILAFFGGKVPKRAPEKWHIWVPICTTKLSLGLAKFGGERLQIGGRGEFAVGDGALDFRRLAQLHMEELFKALHDGGEGRFVSGDIADGLVQIEGRQKFLEFDGIGVPIQRGFDAGRCREKEIRVVQAFLVVVLVEDDFVPGILRCLREQTFFFLPTTLSKSITRVS